MNTSIAMNTSISRMNTSTKRNEEKTCTSTAYEYASTAYNSSRYVVLFESECGEVRRVASRVGGESASRAGEPASRAAHDLDGFELRELALLRERRDLDVVEHQELFERGGGGLERLGVRRVNV